MTHILDSEDKILAEQVLPGANVALTEAINTVDTSDKTVEQANVSQGIRPVSGGLRTAVAAVFGAAVGLGTISAKAEEPAPAQAQQPPVVIAPKGTEEKHVVDPFKKTATEPLATGQNAQQLTLARGGFTPDKGGNGALKAFVQDQPTPALPHTVPHHEHERPWRVGVVGTYGTGLIGGDLYAGLGVGNLDKTHLEFGIEGGHESEKRTLIKPNGNGTYNRIAPHFNLIGGVTVPLDALIKSTLLEALTKRVELTFSGVLGLNMYGYKGNEPNNATRWEFVPTVQGQIDLAYVFNHSFSAFLAGVVARPLTKRIEDYDPLLPMSRQSRTYHTGYTAQLGGLYSF